MACFVWKNDILKRKRRVEGQCEGRPLYKAEPTSEPVSAGLCADEEHVNKKLII